MSKDYDFKLDASLVFKDREEKNVCKFVNFVVIHGKELTCIKARGSYTQW